MRTYRKRRGVRKSRKAKGRRSRRMMRRVGGSGYDRGREKDTSGREDTRDRSRSRDRDDTYRGSTTNTRRNRKEGRSSLFSWPSLKPWSYELSPEDESERKKDYRKLLDNEERRKLEDIAANKNFERIKNMRHEDYLPVDDV